MGISKHYIDTNDKPIQFNPNELADKLKCKIPELVFAYILGSAAKSCIIYPHSDLDLAFYLNKNVTLDIIEKIQEIVYNEVGPVRCDAGILNNADPVYRFEALKGRLLFTMNSDIWLTFYSLTCREYESQIFDYERQWKYRLEARS